LAHCKKVKAEAVLFALMLQKLRQESKVCRHALQKRLRAFATAYGVIQRDAAGAIFETAGRGSRASRSRTRASRSTNPTASQDFIQAVEKYNGVLPTSKGLGKDKGRALIRAVDDNKKKAQRAIFEAIKEAASKAQARMMQSLSRREG
jgi:hypothetical protein